MKHRIQTVLLAFLTILGLPACSTIAPYDQEAYKNATSLKVDALLTMGKATNSYSSQTSEITKLQVALDKAYEYDRGRPLNTITLQMWDKLLNPQGDLLGGFMTEWKDSSSLKPKYIQLKQKQIGEGFDKIIQLESGKIKSSEALK